MISQVLLTQLEEMSLVVKWYDFICFGIVWVSFVGAVYMIWMKEGSGRNRDRSPSLVAPPNNYPKGHVTSAQLWSSCWRGLHPLCLLALRVASFVILSCFLAWDLSKYGLKIYIYYTEWTFTLVILYFAIGTVISAHGCIVYYSKELPLSNGQRDELTKEDAEASVLSSTVKTIKLQIHNDRETIQPRAGFWGYLMQTAYQTCAGSVIMTDFVFWFIIVPFSSVAQNQPHIQLNLLMGCMHTLNLLFLLLDAVVNSLPFPWFRLAYFVLWSCCYVVFQWVIHACGDSTWPYPFLELSTVWAPFWYFCLAVAHIPCYGLYSLLVGAKDSVFSILFPEAFVNTF